MIERVHPPAQQRRPGGVRAWMPAPRRGVSPRQATLAARTRPARRCSLRLPPDRMRAATTDHGPTIHVLPRKRVRRTARNSRTSARSPIGSPLRRDRETRMRSSGRLRPRDRKRGIGITRLGGGARVLAVDSDHPAVRAAVIAFMVERSPRPVGFPDETDRQRVAAHTTASGAPAPVQLAASGLVLAGEPLAASDPPVSVVATKRARPHWRLSSARRRNEGSRDDARKRAFAYARVDGAVSGLPTRETGGDRGLKHLRSCCGERASTATLAWLPLSKGSSPGDASEAAALVRSIQFSSAAPTRGG